MARLSTHVLDASRGTPAFNVVVDLYALRNGERRHIKTVTTNQDGRTDEPLLSGESLEPGVYELTFHAGDYFRRAGVELTDPPFLDEVVVRFGLADAAGRYHVPLLLAPYSYSTYRGS
jgi:5-hydroxyisourate hydrolase